MKRLLRSRSTVPVAPLIVSQVNCEAAAGLKPWKFLELITTNAIPHRVEGKLRLVEASVLVEALRADNQGGGSPTLSEPLTAEREADRVLSLIGRRRAI